MRQCQHPVVIQGGMGVGVSDWRLARAVSQLGQLGVVSGTALDVILPRRLEMGDPGGHVRRALAHFPIPDVAQRILSRYFSPNPKPSGRPFKSKPMPSEAPSRAALELLVASNFVEVFLAREGHDGPVGINYLEKLQPPTLPSIYGAMLAGVSVVLMGAGIPHAIPGILDRFSQGLPAELSLDVQGTQSAAHPPLRFDPREFWSDAPATLPRPAFYAIVSSATLAQMLVKRSTGAVNGFVIENYTAGGHNAPPRGMMQLSREGEPIYGQRDHADLDAIRALGLPFWLAGSFGSPEGLADALARGAAGVQVGTAFAFCRESGLDDMLKYKVLNMAISGSLKVHTDPLASPTGFPFKVLVVPGTRAAPDARPGRICDLGYLRHAYEKEDGTLGWRCPAEPVEDYIRKGGNPQDTQGRMCICNGLVASIGLGQTRPDGSTELPLLTAGDEVTSIHRFLPAGQQSYAAADVVRTLLAGIGQGAPHTPAPAAAAGH
ncbi:MAG: nitronate monooxygenase [Phycisphaeraceae bacterium]|nr:nitronate monooxygenase [Phycisphaeraceae bacterium]